MGRDFVLGIITLAFGGILWWITEAKLDVPRELFAWIGTIFVLLIATTIAVPLLRWLYSRKRREVPMLLIILTGALSGAVLGYIAWNLSAKKYDTEKIGSKTEPQSVAPVSAVRDPVIEVSYGLKGFGLPIPIEPSATAELILIREDRTVELQKITNGRNTRLLWPTPESIFPPESTGKITLSNHGDAGLFNISYSVKIAIQGQKVPGGVIEVPFTLPLHDLLSGKSQSFTIMNQSSFMTLLHFSEAATVEIQSQDQRRQVKVKARDITISDQLTYLQGSLHKWSGLKMLDPDQLKKNQKNDPPGRDHSGLAKD